MPCTIKKDGSLNIYLGGISITNAYPAINGIPIRPIGCECENDSAAFTLSGGVLTLKVTDCGDAIAVDCCIDGMGGIHDISPISSAEIHGCDRGFRQGFGIAGPSGLVGISDAFDSDAVVALGGDKECVTLHVADHAKYRAHYHVENSRLSATFDIEETALNGALPTLYIKKGADFSSALRLCAEDIARHMQARTPDKAAFHWCSWYYLYHNLDQRILEDYLRGFGEYRNLAPFSHIQIDAGYFPSCGDWLDPHPRFPGGLEKAAETIRAAGFQPGIWIGPFMVGDESRLFREHPDWMLRNNDGSFVTCWRQYNEPKPWGYADSDYYVLDTSHPGAMDYIINVFKTLRRWGYTLFKTDFLLWGMHDSSKVCRHTPGKTSFEYFREFMENVRGAIGEDAAWLGCIAPFMPAVGFVDMMRIAGDVGTQWEEGGFGPVNMIQEIHADQYFNNVYWQNDPDAVLLRDFHIHLRPAQIEALAILQAISGGVITTSDPIHKIAPERRALLRLIRPRGVVKPAFPYWQENNPVEIITAQANRGRLAFFFNPTDSEVTLPCDWARLLGDADWRLRRLHGKDSIRAAQLSCVTIPARSGALYFASREPLPCEPQNMWDWDYAERSDI